MRRILMALAVMSLTLMLSGCGYNTIQQKDEAVKAAWSQVLNVYKRRADLVPNLVATVRGYASHEAQVLTQVTEARAKVGSINVNADDPASLQQFQEAQAGLRQGVSIKQLAGDLGYANPSALSRAFAVRAGCSPRDWLRGSTSPAR